jgi:phenylacetate-CoA ligase
MSITQEERLTAERIAVLQQKAWAKTCRHAQAHSPFYREHLRRAGATAQRPLPLREIGRIPPIDQSVLSNQPAAFLCVPPERVVDIVTTSGTAGEPFVGRLTEADLQRLALGEHHSFRCAGLTHRASRFRHSAAEPGDAAARPGHRHRRGPFFPAAAGRESGGNRT